MSDMTFKDLAPEINSNQAKLILREMLKMLPEKRLGTIAFGARGERARYESDYDRAWNTELDQATEAINKFFGEDV